MTCPLAKEVIAAAARRNLTLVTAESCTAGGVARALSQAPGAAKHLHGGFVTYTKAMKHQALGVSWDLLKEKTAVCAEVAEAMVRGALARSPADIALSITGVVGPEPDEDGNPVGLVYCCTLTQAGDINAAKYMFDRRPPEAILKATVTEALNLLRDACR